MTLTNNTPQTHTPKHAHNTHRIGPLQASHRMATDPLLTTEPMKSTDPTLDRFYQSEADRTRFERTDRIGRYVLACLTLAAILYRLFAHV